MTNRIPIYLTPEVAEDIRAQIELSESLSLKEVSELSGISLRTIQRHIKDNILPYEKRKGKKVVTRENFNKYLKR